MRILRVVALLLLVSATFLAASCALRDYVLDFAITSATVAGTTITVGYYLKNDGNKDLKNATIEIAAQAQYATGQYTGTYTAWTPSVDLGVGDSVYSSILIGLPSGSYQATASASVISSAWDDSGGLFGP
ncbi:MAG TPA: hypothetical protein VMC79_02345 [Rectinemataceae bacterium]|nr:hypothetical protein [Rectinemataceae bacterium]